MAVDEEEPDEEEPGDEEGEDADAAADGGAPAQGSAGGGSRRPEKDALKVFVGGLPFAATKSEVRTHLEECGEIDWLHMPRDDQGRSRGIAFASFWDEESLQRALQLDGTDFQGRALKVNMSTAKPAKSAAKHDGKDGGAPKRHEEGGAGAASAAKGGENSKARTPAKDREVFIGSIPFDCSEEVLRKDFSECGKIEKLDMPMHDEGRSKGVAFITFATPEGVEAALKYNGTKYGKCTLVVRRSSEKKPDRSAAEAAGKKKGQKRKANGAGAAAPVDREPKEFEVIVKGLHFKAKEESLREKLGSCGEIESFRMPLNKKGRCLGFAFVAFQTKKGVKKALKLSGSELEGRPVVVEQTSAQETAQCVAEPQEDPPEEPERPGKKAKRAAAQEEPEAAGGEGCAEELGDASQEADDETKARVDKRKVAEDFSKEEILARTKANRDKRKANREKFKSAAEAAHG